jgi:phosphoglycolate phosphatase-like HAD superfamily hydrolase
VNAYNHLDRRNLNDAVTAFLEAILFDLDGTLLDLSEATVETLKPSPEPLLRAARDIGAHATRCVYVGDSECDVLAAVRAGMGSFVATWGDELATREPWMQRAAAMFERPEDILGAIDAMLRLGPRTDGTR